MALPVSACVLCAAVRRECASCMHDVQCKRTHAAASCSFGLKGHHRSGTLNPAGERALESLREVDASVVPWFRAAAEQLLGEFDDPAEALSRALARITGFSAIRVRPCCR